MEIHTISYVVLNFLLPHERAIRLVQVLMYGKLDIFDRRLSINIIIIILIIGGHEDIIII